MTATLSRWLARLAATALTALFITFLVREGVGDLRELTDQEIAEFGALLVMVIGTLLAWRRDLIGAALMVVGYAAFAWLEGGWPPFPFAVYPVAAGLLLLSAVLRRLRRAAPPGDSPVAEAAGPAPAAPGAPPGP